LLLQKREEGLKIDSESERLKTCGGGLRSPSYRAMENHIQRKGMNKMNQTQTRSPRKRLLSLILAVILMIGLLPISAFATSASAQAGEDKAATQDSEFLRIFHLDCGRKYFTVDQIKQMIDYAAESNYTHVELAFGNDGLRFLLDDMSVEVNGTTYASDKVTSAIKQGNKEFYDAGTNELTQSEMQQLIGYAREKKIGIIPMFDAPGHLQAVIRGMQALGLNVVYTTPTMSGTSVNWAIDPTDTASLAFVKALMEKYVAYFAKYGSSKYFNIAADECGFAQMSTEQYTAYATFVNSLAAMVKGYGFTVMAFNDGFYYQNKTTTEDFDTDIVICYWDATADMYAPAKTLASKNFRIINTHNKWYYVIGNESTGWYGAEWSKSNMTGKYSKCNVTDGDYQTNYGCMNAIWCDDPSASVNMTNVETHIKTLAQQTCNKSFFTEVTTTPTGPDPVEPTESKTAADAELKVSVTVNLKAGQNLTLAVSKAENSQAVFDQGVEFVAYDVAPSVDGEPYRGQGTVTLPVPAEWTAHKDRIGAYIITDGKTVTLTEVTVADDKVTFTAPHFSEMGLYLAAERTDPDVTENRTVTVTVDKTDSDTITGANYAGDTYVTENPDIAAVTVTGTDEQKESYNPEKAMAGDLANYNSGWTKTDYYYTDDNINYYPVYGKYENTGWGWYATTTYYWGYSTTDSAANVTVIDSSTDYDTQVTVYTKSSDPTPASTTVTFTGKKVGTTYVTVGTVRYTIKVVAENLDGVKALPIQLWITNNTIQVDKTSSTKTGSGWKGSTGYVNYVSVDAGKAYGEQGVTLKEAIGLTEPLARYEYGGTRYIDKQTNNSPKQNLVLWSGRIHNSGNIQQVWQTDYSNSGAEFNYVRYWGGKWAVSNDRKEWKPVTGEGSTGTYSSCKEQLAAYYMIRTEITKEVTTDIADWGEPKNSSKYNDQVGTDFVLLDFAVKYENGNRVPSGFPVDETMAFHCASDSSAVGTQNGVKYRKLNNFRGVNTSDYEIYMVTVTMTDDNASNRLTSSTAQSGYTYGGTEQIVWAIDEKTKTNSNLDAYTSISGAKSDYSGCTIGGDPYVRGVEIYNKHGALITYYIRAKVKTDSLSVHYVVQNTGEEFYKYFINVNNEAGHDMAFKDGIQLNNPWKGVLLNSEVVNAEGRTLTITADLTNLPIDAQYRYSTYTCEKVETKKVNNVNKEVWLYYTFTSTATFVVDFGLPLKIAPANVSANLSVAPIKTVQIAHSTKYADLSVDENKNIIYRLTKTIDGEDNITVRYTGTNASTDKIGEASFTLTIIPASNVYYEDSLATFTDGSGAASGADWKLVDSNGNENVTEDTTTTQALQQLGDKAIYGNDDAYNSSSKLSMGTAHKVTVTAAMLEAYNGGNTGNFAWPTAQFTFKGTGFDIISLTDNTSGAIVVDVYKGSKTEGSKPVHSYLVNNYYGYTYNQETKKWEVVKDGKENAIYQIPVMKVNDLPYGEYTAVVQVFYNSFFDENYDEKSENNQYSFWLDAVRIYDPMDEYAGYTQDHEGYPQYIKLHDEVVKEKATPNVNALFIDGKENATIAEYTSYGPNNEVYLMNGQAITFKIPQNANVDSIQIGAKAPDGNTTMTVTGTKDTVLATEALSTATEMYYKIDVDVSTADQTVVIANKDGTGILSLTNLKITYKTKPAENEKVTLAALDTQEQENAVNLVRALFTAPVATFSPETFEADWGRAVRAGKRATLTVKTSADVESITVDGQSITSYTTRTQRTGWGWWSPKVTYHVFTYTITAPAQTTDYAVCAVNAEGTASEAVTATLTVKPTTWWNWWF